MSITREQLNAFYTSMEWRELRERVKRQWKASKKPCAFCGEVINRNDRVIVDHVKTVREFWQYRLEPRNLAVLHHSCHSKKTAFIDMDKRPILSTTGFPPDWE